MMFKFELKQVVFYMMDNRVHSAPIRSRMIVENVDLYNDFGLATMIYATIHGKFQEHLLFESREALAAHLVDPKYFV